MLFQNKCWDIIPYNICYIIWQVLSSPPHHEEKRKKRLHFFGVLRFGGSRNRSRNFTKLHWTFVFLKILVFAFLTFGFGSKYFQMFLVFCLEIPVIRGGRSLLRFCYFRTLCFLLICKKHSFLDFFRNILLR